MRFAVSTAGSAVESKPGAGSTFYVEIPQAGPRHGGGARGSPAPSEAGARSR